MDVRKRSSSKDIIPTPIGVGQVTIEKGRNSSYNVAEESKQYPALSKDVSRGRLRPNDLNNGSSINIRNMNSSQEK